MTDKTGGPAFPSKQKALLIKSEHQDIASEYEIECNGMTLRDYFAAKAMQALIRFEDKALPYMSRNTLDFDSRVSYQAYRYADAMLKAREP